MTTAAFDAMESDALWLENMRDLIHGRSDRAVKHVALQLERQERENPPVAWKAARQLLYFCIEVLEISRPVDAEALACKSDVEDRYCSICREERGPKAEPLALHNSSHLVCEPCLITWCLKQGPGCRQRLCSDEVLRTWFNFGAKGKTYAYDDRYNEWEKYTRSIADLDEHLAKNNSTWITIHGDVALSIWDDIVTHDLLETPSSTPYHLQPARSIHYAFLRSSLETSPNTRTGLHYPTSSAYDVLLAEFRGRLSVECRETGGVGIVNGPGGFWEYGLAPGFMEFAKRTLSRTLQFLSLRVCHCSERGEGGFHLHGLRKYYNLDVPTEELIAETIAKLEETSMPGLESDLAEQRTGMVENMRRKCQYERATEA
ncbi:hypothetical protein LTR74_002423 [Friedmanniomyces endolithicus]|nr:hypothetical protein LTR74_002423 [Friedmanniomyces endolithicus]